MNPTEQPSRERRVRFGTAAETMVKAMIQGAPAVRQGVLNYAHDHDIACLHPFTGQVIPFDYRNERNPERILSLFYGNLEHALKESWQASEQLDEVPDLADIDMNAVDLNTISRTAMGIQDQPEVEIDEVLDSADKAYRDEIEKLASRKQLKEMQEDMKATKEALQKSKAEKLEKDELLEKTKKDHEEEEKKRNQHEEMRNKSGPGFSQVLKEAARFNLEIAAMVAIMDILALAPFTLVFFCANMRDIQPETPEEWLQVFMKTGGKCMEYVETNLGVGMQAYSPDENKGDQFAAQQAAAQQAAAASQRPKG